jgi:hypothetical protein
MIVEKQMEWKTDEDEQYVDTFILSDEAVFRISDTVKRHSCVYWSSASSTLHVEKAVNVCVISCGDTVGPGVYV